MTDSAMEMILDRVRDEVRRVLALRAEPRMVRIGSFDPLTHAVKVQVLPDFDFPIEDGVAETGWIPHGPVAGGNGWGIYAPPLPGTQGMMAHQEGAAGSGVIVTTVNDQANPPSGAQAGEIWLVHSSTNTWIKLTNDQNAAIQAHGSLTITTTTGDCTITVHGNCNITAQGQANLLSAAEVNLGAVGGRKVVRDGDPCTMGGSVTATTTTVFSA